MPNTAIVYQSPHHGNTKKLLDAIVQAHPDVKLFRAETDAFTPDAFDVIGFASGIYMGKLHRTVQKAMDSVNGIGRKTFVVFTCGDLKGGKYGERYPDMLREKGFEFLGMYYCVGHDSFGPLKLVGGVNKGRPNEEDIRGAVTFFDGLKL
jgi:hypothetical protein